MGVDDNTLWWWMIGLGLAAAALSIGTTMLDRRNVQWPSHRTRHHMHMASYVLTSLSILIFVARGILLP